MRVGVGDDTDWQNALAAMGIRTALLFWFDFDSGGVGVWTGSHGLTVVDSDTLLNGKTFEPINEGIPVNIGGNSFSYQGSEALTLSLTIPETPTDAMVYGSADPEEYQGRTAVVWRAMMITPPTESTPSVWAFKRVRAGAMDELVIAGNGKEHTFTLTIEAHASMISNATGSTYLDQKTKFDATDTSQDWAAASANTPGSPKRGAAGGFNGGYGGGGGGGGSFGGGGLHNLTVWN